MEFRIKMNIFALDIDPQVCATYHCDKHVVKMILEHAQMICTAHHLHPRSWKYDVPYKKAYENHPCAKWVRESVYNYEWLYNLSYYLNEEYKLRFNHDVNHKSWDVIKSLPVPDIPTGKFSEFAQAMPDDCKDFNGIIAYRDYYNEHKEHLHKWTKRERPTWIR